MKVRLVVPGGASPGEPRSGGSLYDVELARALRELGHDAQVSELPSPGAFNLFDGLGAAQWAERVREVPGVNIALMHQSADALGADAAAVKAERAFLAGCSAAHFVSARARAGAEALHGALPRHWVAPPGVDHFTPRAPHPERHLVANGHVWEGKGVLEALELVATLPGEWHLDWLGALDVDAAYTARVLAKRSALGLEARVTFHGRVSRSEVAQHLARAAAMLCTSRSESWGLAIAEALRAGLPVVSNTPAGVIDFIHGRGVRGGELRPWLLHLLGGDARELRDEAQRAGASLPTWAACAAKTVHALEAL